MPTPAPAAPMPDPRSQAGTVRRACHLALAALGWTLFAYWWWLVLRRVSPAEVRFTGWFLLFSLFVIVAVTALWVLHNVRLFRNKKPRQVVREAEADLRHDTLGRELTVEGSDSSLAQAPVVRIQVTNGHKLYRLGEAPSAARFAEPAGAGAVGDAE